MRTLAAELAPTPRRWWRAARVASVTATGAAVMAILQIVNPLGLTMLFNFGVPEAAFSLGTALAFLAAAAIVQSLGLAIVGALVDAPSVHLVVFIIVSAVSSYVIYAVPRLGRLWIWVQIPAVTAFYLVIFQAGQPRMGQQRNVRQPRDRSRDPDAVQQRAVAGTGRVGARGLAGHHARSVAPPARVAGRYISHARRRCRRA